MSNKKETKIQATRQNESPSVPDLKLGLMTPLALLEAWDGRLELVDGLLEHKEKLPPGTQRKIAPWNTAKVCFLDHNSKLPLGTKKSCLM